MTIKQTADDYSSYENRAGDRQEDKLVFNYDGVIGTFLGN